MSMDIRTENVKTMSIQVCMAKWVHFLGLLPHYTIPECLGKGVDRGLTIMFCFFKWNRIVVYR